MQIDVIELHICINTKLHNNYVIILQLLIHIATLVSKLVNLCDICVNDKR